MMTRLLPGAALLGLAGLVLAVALWLTAGPEARPGSVPAQLPRADARAGPDPATDGAQAPSPAAIDERALDEQQILADLRARFGPDIGIPHAQLRVLEQLISYLKAQYPDDWETRVRDFLARLFPARAESLYARFQSLMQYNGWLAQNRSTLGRMPAGERREALWAQRYLAFGPDADTIWAAERNSQQLADSLAALAPEAPVAAQLEAFVSAVHDIYGEGAGALLAKRAPELSNRFVSQPTVQQALREMAVDERRETLRGIRRALGMDAAAVQRWDALDARRDSEWARGQGYAAERRALVAAHGPEAAQPHIAALRRDAFGPLAEIIASEEASGFFRFERPRRIGRE